MNKKTEIVAAAAVIALLVVIAAWTAPRLFLLFDEAYNLNLSATLAGAGLYATRLSGGVQPFDPAISSGPTLLAPLALALRLGGATLSTVRATMLVLFGLALLLGYLAARQALPPAPALAFLIVFAATPLVIEFGLCVLGDVTAIALALLAIGLLARAEQSARPRPWLIAGGAALGLSLLSKEIMLLLLLGMALAGAWSALRGTPTARVAWFIGLPGVIALAMLAAWQVYAGLATAQMAQSEALLPGRLDAGAAALEHWRTVAFAPLSRLSLAALRPIFDYFGPLLLSGLLALVAAGALPLLPLREKEGMRVDLSPTSPLTLTLSPLGRGNGPRCGSEPGSAALAWRVIAAACLTWLAWFVLVSGPQAEHRHLLPGVILAELWTLRVLAVLAAAAPKNLAARTLALALVISLLWSIGHGVGYLRLYLASSEPRLQMQQSAAAWIRQNVPANQSISGWGWFVPWHVAFLAERTPARDWPETELMRMPSQWFVLCPEIAWSGSTDDDLRAFLARHGPPVLDQRLYPVYRIAYR